MDCTYCGKELDSEELETPYKDGDDDVMCDDCHHEHCEFTCDLCEEYGDIDEQHKMLILLHGPQKSSLTTPLKICKAL